MSKQGKQDKALATIGALWLRIGRDGRPFLSGHIEVNGARLGLLLFAARDGDAPPELPPVELGRNGRPKPCYAVLAGEDDLAVFAEGVALAGQPEPF